MKEVALMGLMMGGVLAVTVGPTFIAMIVLSSLKGRISGFFFAFGVLLSDILIAAVVYYLAEVLMFYVQGKEAQLAGAAFLLIYGGLGLIPRSKNTSFETNGYELVDGFIINIINPGCYALWIGFAALCPNYQYMELYLIIILFVNFSIDLLKVYLASIIKIKQDNKGVKITNYIIPVIFLLTGVIMLINYFK